jgi:uncharacterized protein
MSLMNQVNQRLKPIALSVLMSLSTSFSAVPAALAETVKLNAKTVQIYGSLEIPESSKPVPVVLIIAGSGPTDRDGNQPNMQSNSNKLLAEGLKKAGIASLRYDKRGIAESQIADLKEDQLRFEDFIHDAADWVHLLKADPRFSSVFVLGHSEGSLIGLALAEQDTVKSEIQGLISVAGAGRAADKIILEQVQSQSQELGQQTAEILAAIEKNKELPPVPAALQALFRPSILPYLRSWFAYDPQKLAHDLTMPLLILQGDHDLQVQVKDAQQIYQAQPKAELQIFKGMNHVLKAVPADRNANLASYNQPTQPLHPELMPHLVHFIQAHQ